MRLKTLNKWANKIRGGKILYLKFQFKHSIYEENNSNHGAMIVKETFFLDILNVLRIDKQKNY